MQRCGGVSHCNTDPAHDPKRTPAEFTQITAADAYEFPGVLLPLPFQQWGWAERKGDVSRN
jgi:hypothetical protein